MVRPRWIAAALAVLLLGGAAAALAGRGGPPPELHGTLLDPPLPAAPFRLPSAGEAPLGPEGFRGRVVVLFFGFTHCPDVCPLTMQRLGRAMQLLGERADEVQVILVSVDPERDRPEAVDAYARRFDPRFRGVTGPEDEVRGVASAYGIFFARTPGGAASGYTVDHSAQTLVLDREGRLRLVWPFDTTAEGMADDLRFLLR